MDGNKLVLAGDIGGTKTHLGLFRMGEERPELQNFRTFSSRKAKSLEEILEKFLEGHKKDIRAACLGVAGPVLKGISNITNLDWDASETKLKDHFGWNKIKIVNDLSATALGTVLLNRDELHCLNDKDPDPTGAIGIVAPGTGLGISLLIQSNDKLIPLPSEGGHADFAPRNESEVALWRLLHESLGHVSVERLVSGPGIYKIYKTLRQIRDHEEPHWPESQAYDQDPSAAVSRAALEDKDELSLQAIKMFCEMFGAVAGNLALIGFTTGGIYLAGGVPKKILPFLKDDHFMNAFLDKGRFRSFLESIPVRVVLNEKTALMGAAKCALEM